jgi:hypothetical protein
MATPEERAERVAAMERRDALRKEREKEREKERRVAEAKAKKLLEECLTPVQKRAFRRWGTIPVVAESGKRYRIEKGWSGNVVELERGKVQARYCCHPKGVHSLPTYDVMLAQKLSLEADENHFVKTAVVTSMRRTA